MAAHGEEGLGVALATATTCPSGWAPLAVVAQHHLTSLRIDAVSSRGSRGVWSGPVPVAAGAPALRVTDGAGVANASLPSLRRVVAAAAMGAHPRACRR